MRKTRGEKSASGTGRASPPPRVAVLATGGTIAGRGAGADQFTAYKSGAIRAEKLLAAVPEIGNHARVGVEQFANVDSSQMTAAIWLRLAKRINALLAGDVDGVVVAHGTDTLEETAYFLNLTVKSAKPVVLTGAMRPATAISADGPLNLMEAVIVAASPQAAGKGVLATMNGTIAGARFVTKTNTQRADAFQSPDFGCLGHVVQGRALFCKASARRHTVDSEFDVSGLSSLPKVEIVYSYADAGPGAAKGALAGKPAGIVCGGVGNGLIFGAVEKALRQAARRGVVVVRSSRAGTGVVTREAEDDAKGFVAADSLPPPKARILLMLALTKTSDPAEIQRMFLEY